MKIAEGAGSQLAIATNDDGDNKHDFWTRRTTLERRLIVTLLSALILVVVLVIAISAVATSKRPVGVCITAGCAKAAARLLNAMDTSVDPCEDFYTYACGTWDKRHVISSHQSRSTVFGELQDETNVKLKALMESLPSDDEPTAVFNARELYQSCNNLSKIESLGAAPLQQMIKQLGSWPLLGSIWKESEFNLEEAMASVATISRIPIVSTWISTDLRDSKVNVIQFDQSSLFMPNRDYYLLDRFASEREAYMTYAVEVAKLLGGDPNRARKELTKVLHLETALANISAPESERQDWATLYRAYTISELYANVTRKTFDWLKFMKAIYSHVGVDNDITENETVIVYATDYMLHLPEVLAKTSSRTMANYIVWRAIGSMIGAMSSPFATARRTYVKVLKGTTGEPPRWLTCVNEVNSYMGMAVARLFLVDNFDPQTKLDAEVMIEEIRNSFNNLLSEVPWLDDTTRGLAKQKADAIKQAIGYPNEILNDTYVNSLYKVSLSKETYFENIAALGKASVIKMLKRLRKPVDKLRWHIQPAVVNAFYSPLRNAIVFPAGILQSPFYDYHSPRSLNFGGIGSVIGHEITHGFDNSGRRFDRFGNVRQWWTQEVSDAFEKSAQCFVEQYGNYTVAEVDLKLDGKLTLGENIADNGGMKQAFMAYRNWVEKQGHEEDLLPGINLSHNQLFFVGMAQNWCGLYRPKSLLLRLRTDPHSTGRARVIGPMSNSNEFAAAYNCPVGSPMNPRRKKCALW